MIALLGGLALLAAPTVLLRSAGVADRLLDGPVPVLIDVDAADAEAGAGTLLVEYKGIDGDTVQHARSIPIVPGSKTKHWVVIDPPSFSTAVSASLIDADGVPLAVASPMQLDLLAEPVSRLAAGAGSKPSLLLIVGTDQLGLEALQLSLSNLVLNEPALAISTNVESMPPSATALRGVNTIVWGDGGPPDDPLARAILEWVDAGGHLVLTPPAMGAPWGPGSGMIAAASGLESVGPAEPVHVSALAALFDHPLSGEAPMLADIPDTHPWQAIRRSPSGVPLITRTALGLGHITAVALDPSRRALASMESDSPTGVRLGLAEAWGPILARRDLPSAPLFRTIVKEERLRQNLLHWGTDNLSDRLMYSTLGRSTSVSARLLLAAAFSATYLLIGGLVVWRVLRDRQRMGWTWPAFGATAVVFAVAAWLLGTALMPSLLHVKHFTVLDHVAGTDDHQVQSWLDLQLPGTGDRELMVRNEATETARIAPWRSRQVLTPITFGDVRRLPPRTHEDAMHVIARNANTRAHVYWRGTADPEQWGRLLSSEPDDPIRADDTALYGTLVNRLPVALTDVSLIWITGDASVRPDDGLWQSPDNAGHPLVRGQWWRLGRLQPGATVDLAAIEVSAKADLLFSVYGLQEAHVPNDGQERLHRGATLLSVFSLFTPPPWARPPTDPTSSERENNDRLAAPDWTFLDHSFARDLDLGPWLASPALIVLGWADAETLPFPLLVDAEAPDVIEGEVLVRWILPLNVDTVGGTN